MRLGMASSTANVAHVKKTRQGILIRQATCCGACHAKLSTLAPASGKSTHRATFCHARQHRTTLPRSGCSTGKHLQWRAICQWIFGLLAERPCCPCQVQFQFQKFPIVVAAVLLAVVTVALVEATAAAVAVDVLVVYSTAVQGQEKGPNTACRKAPPPPLRGS